MDADRRLEALRNAPLDSWLAWNEEDEIIATADTYEEVVKKADELGWDDPMISLTPPTWGHVVTTPIFGPEGFPEEEIRKQLQAGEEHEKKQENE